MTKSAAGLLVLLLLSAAQAPPLWVEATPNPLPETSTWINKVEGADLNGDGRPDLLFANGGDYSTPGKPEPNGAYINRGGRLAFEDRSAAVFGPTPDPRGAAIHSADTGPAIPASSESPSPGPCRPARSTATSADTRGTRC